MLPILHPPAVGTRASLGLLAVRLVIGCAFVLHGWGKIQHPFDWMGPGATMPGFLQACAALSEFGGGACWMLGLLTPIASLGLLATMTVAMLTHLKRGDPFVSMSGPSFEPAFAYLSVAVLLFVAGPGSMSVDAFLAKRR